MSCQYCIALLITQIVYVNAFRVNKIFLHFYKHFKKYLHKLLMFGTYFLCSKLSYCESISFETLILKYYVATPCTSKRPVNKYFKIKFLSKKTLKGILLRNFGLALILLLISGLTWCIGEYN
jgi:hypothetical protein